MSPHDVAGLSSRELVAIEAALAEDEALAEELELLASFFAPGARVTFWCALAAGLEADRRPAAAVLGALERASGIEP